MDGFRLLEDGFPLLDCAHAAPAFFLCRRCGVELCGACTARAVARCVLLVPWARGGVPVGVVCPCRAPEADFAASGLGG